MGLDIFYKVRAKRQDNQTISVEEKGLLKILRSTKQREDLKNTVKNYLENYPDQKIAVGIYVYDVGEGWTKAVFTRDFAEKTY